MNGTQCNIPFVFGLFVYLSLLHTFDLQLPIIKKTYNSPTQSQMLNTQCKRNGQSVHNDVQVLGPPSFISFLLLFLDVSILSSPSPSALLMFHPRNDQFLFIMYTHNTVFTLSANVHRSRASLPHSNVAKFAITHQA